MNRLGPGRQPLPMPGTAVPAAPTEGTYENLYHMLLRAIPFSLLLIDTSLRVLSANRNFLEKSHRTEENTIGMRIRDIFPDVIMDSPSWRTRCAA